MLIQGLTLRRLVRALGMPHDDTVESEIREARLATIDAALAALADERGQEAEALRAELQAERQIAGATEDADARPTSLASALRAKALAARRERLLAMRSEGVIGDQAFHRIEEELDFSELALSMRI